MEKTTGSVFSFRPIIVTPGSSARITVGDDRGAKFELELSATEAVDGGFELVTDLKRVE